MVHRTCFRLIRSLPWRLGPRAARCSGGCHGTRHQISPFDLAQYQILLPARSELQVQRELPVARIGSGARNLAERRARRIGVRTREIRMVPGVITLRPKLHRHSFCYRKVLDSRQIPCCPSVAAEAAEEQWKRAEIEFEPLTCNPVEPGFGIKPALDAPLALRKLDVVYI